jgi:hypothetical protein
MSSSLQDQVRDLAYHIWVSAGEEYGRALDCWLMAEQMVVEMSLATSRLAGATFAATPLTRAGNGEFSEVYVGRVRDLAYAMWDAAEQHVDWTMDFWLAAEQHVRAMTQAAARTAGSAVGAEKTISRALDAFSAEQYLERIRRTAYAMWEAAGRQYGRSLDFWLAAERQVLQSMNPVAAGFEPSALREVAARSEVASTWRSVGAPQLPQAETPKTALPQTDETAFTVTPGLGKTIGCADPEQRTEVRGDAGEKPSGGTATRQSKGSRRGANRRP